MARTLKSEEQRAQEALEVAQRKVDRLEAEEKRLTDELRAVRIQHSAAVKIRDYRAAHPALQVTEVAESDERADG